MINKRQKEKHPAQTKKINSQEHFFFPFHLKSDYKAQTYVGT